MDACTCYKDEIGLFAEREPWYVYDWVWIENDYVTILDGGIAFGLRLVCDAVSRPEITPIAGVNKDNLKTIWCIAKEGNPDRYFPLIDIDIVLKAAKHEALILSKQ